MTKEEFERGYARRSGYKVNELRRAGLTALPCDCGKAGCQGWRMIVEERVTFTVPSEEEDKATGLHLPKLPLEDCQRLIDFIEWQGKKRAWSQGVEFSEVDFLMGAYAVLSGLGWGEEVPVGWIFAPLRDEPVLQTAAQKRRHRLWCGENNARLEKLKGTVQDALRHAEAATRKVEVLEDVILGYEDGDGPG